VSLKYDHSDPDWNVTPINPVDYSKAQIDVDKLMEPISPESVSNAVENSAEQVELTIT